VFSATFPVELETSQPLPQTIRKYALRRPATYAIAFWPEPRLGSLLILVVSRDHPGSQSTV